MTRALVAIALATSVIASSPRQSGAATITVVNGDSAGEGFNDTTSVSPVGGNAGTTLGAQRLNAFTYAANLWGAQLTSAVTIKVDATMDALTCSLTSATLGSAGANTLHYNFTNAPYTNTWYPQALANKIVGSDLIAGTNDLVAYFNSAIGTTCSFPKTWYYGLDGNPGATQFDFVTVVLHELGHGLGFQTYVTLSSGARYSSRDDIFMKFLEDHSLGLTWPNMTDAQRAASAIDDTDLHWTGSTAVAAGTILTGGRHAASGHIQMYAPSTVSSGSSVSHWDTDLTPNELMEPSYTVDLTDPSLARDLMTDLGWDYTTTTSSTTTSSTTTTSTSTSTTSTSKTTTSTTTSSSTSTTSTSSTSTTSTSSTSTSSTTSSSTSTTSTSSSSSTSSSTTSTTSTSSTSTSSTSTTSSTVPVACTAAPQTFSNGTATPLTDGGLTTSTIVVSGLGTVLQNVELTTALTHANAGDLDVTLTSPAGTVVTITTDNGEGASNVFNGTRWYVDADPAGLVPYDTNDGVVADHPFTSGVAVATLTPEESLGAFVGEDPNGTWTLRVSDDTTGATGSLSSWSLTLTALTQAIPTAAASFTNATAVTIPAGPAVVTAQTTVSGAATFLVDLDVYTVMPHTYSSDLDVTLTSPAGTVVTLTTDNAPGINNAYNGTLWNDDANPGGQVPYTANNGLATDRTAGGTATSLVPEEPLAAFVGENPNGTWTLTISDDAAADGGTLSQWRLDVTTGACLATTTTTTTSSTSTSSSSSTTTSTSSSTSTSTSTTSTSSSSTTSTSASTTTSTSSTTSSTSATSTSTSSTTSSSTSSSTTTTTSTSASSTTIASSTTTSSTSTSTSSSSSSSSSSTTSTSSSTTTLPPAQDDTLCPAVPLASCSSDALQHSSLLLRAGGSPARDALKWRVQHGAVGIPGDLRDPVTGPTIVGLCLYDASATTQPLLAGALLPGGSCGPKPCWQAMRGGYRYKHRAGNDAGITDLKLRMVGGRLQLLAKGKGIALPLPVLGLVTPVRFQIALQDDDGTVCWESTFTSAVANDPALFKATGH